MKKSRLHISQTTFMPSLLSSLKEKGVTVDKYLKQSKLDAFDLSQYHNYVPNVLLYDFMYKVQRSQGLYSITNDFYEDFRLKSGGDFGVIFHQQPNFLKSLQDIVRMPFILRTNHILDLTINGKEACFSFEFTDKPSKERYILDDIGWAQTFDAFRSAAGQDFTPKAIYTTYSSFQRIQDIVPKGEYPIYYKQKVNKLVFSSDILFNALNQANLSGAEPLNELSSYTSQINHLLNSASAGTALSLADVSSFTNLPTRTIKRKLAEEGTSFSQLASNVFLSKATMLLNSTQYSVKEI
ncbi:MAG: hypothetical protein MI866_05995, partial [Bacteroidales bacterium]|nr:hypothetical protein [Bacteroidales bacterium]